MYANLNVVVRGRLEIKGKQRNAVPVDVFTNAKCVPFAESMFRAGDSDQKNKKENVHDGEMMGDWPSTSEEQRITVLRIKYITL